MFEVGGRFPDAAESLRRSSNMYPELGVGILGFYCWSMMDGYGFVQETCTGVMAKPHSGMVAIWLNSRRLGSLLHPTFMFTRNDQQHEHSRTGVRRSFCEIWSPGEITPEGCYGHIQEELY